MRALAKVDDFDPHDLRRTASTWAHATCPSPWVDRLLDDVTSAAASTEGSRRSGDSMTSI
jgi:hypothetical protein